MHNSEHTETHWTVYSKRVNVIACDSNLNKADIKKFKERNKNKKFKGENLGLGFQRISYHNY